MAYQFYVIMQKRSGGKVYADVHKTTEKIYFTEEEALSDMNQDELLKNNFHVVPLVAMTLDEYNECVNPNNS